MYFCILSPCPSDHESDLCCRIAMPPLSHFSRKAISTEGSSVLLYRLFVSLRNKDVRLRRLPWCWCWRSLPGWIMGFPKGVGASKVTHLNVWNGPIFFIYFFPSHSLSFFFWCYFSFTNVLCKKKIQMIVLINCIFVFIYFCYNRTSSSLNMKTMLSSLLSCEFISIPIQGYVSRKNRW